MTNGRARFVGSMSGGLDSSVIDKQGVEGVDPAKVLGLALPEAAGGGHETDARAYAKELGIRFRTIAIGGMVDSIAKNLKIRKSDRVGLGNVKARARMIALYQVAREEDRLVLGTGNKSELAL